MRFFSIGDRGVALRLPPATGFRPFRLRWTASARQVRSVGLEGDKSPEMIRVIRAPVLSVSIGIRGEILCSCFRIRIQVSSHAV